MAGVENLWFYVQHFEMGPILEAVDARFAERAGQTRSEALHEHPDGGEWVDVWLAAFNEVGEERKNLHMQLLTGVMLGMPSHNASQTSEFDWHELQRGVSTRHDHVQDAALQWQFLAARTAAGELWEAMGHLWERSTEAADGLHRTSSWVDLRPIL
jgi:hypothetical protein